MRVPETPPATSHSGGVLVLANDLTPHLLNIGPSLSIFTRFLVDVSELFRSFDKSPLAKLAFFLGCDGSLIRSTSWAAISDAFAALFGADSLRRVVQAPARQAEGWLRAVPV